MKKLVLNKETVRVLQDSELRRIAGGDGDPARIGNYGYTDPISRTCPCPSSITDGGGGLYQEAFALVGREMNPIEDTVYGPQG
ncbi:MAG: class I lanthipeptide [Phycisphaerae bacterium]|nr:class I lanthipeptide [Phycisphaerae bacterium]